ncbi:MAG: winged helix-turn-helix transcriptional regulator [Firmicutes bacterium]|nr:winged helix-turn-helix transcriptional regulator [Bacillota bacterium]
METLLKALGESTRLKIVKLLSVQELCVCELEAVLNISQPRVSQHLKVLRKAGVIQERKEKQRSFYRLDQDIRSGRLPAFSAYIDADLNQIGGMADEARRLSELEGSEVVSRCLEDLERPPAGGVRPVEGRNTV